MQIITFLSLKFCKKTSTSNLRENLDVLIKQSVVLWNKDANWQFSRGIVAIGAKC